MACGKTTLGQALFADGYGEFIDLDELICGESGLSPAEWFAQKGESSFRQAELEAIRHLCQSNRPAIIATGGGTPSNGDALRLMLAHGLVVWLEASLERTIERLLDAPGQRPLVAGMDREALVRFIPQHFAGRRPFYSQAHCRFDSSWLDTPEEIEQSLGRFKHLILTADKQNSDNKP